MAEVAGSLPHAVASALRRRRSGAQTALFLAYKDVTKDWKVAGLVVCVLGFSYVNLIFFTSFQYGLQNSFEEELISTFTSHIVVEPKEGRRYIEDAGLVEDKVSLIPGVMAVAPNLEDPGIQIEYKQKSAGSHLVGVVPSRYAQVSAVPAKVVEGEFLGDGDTDQVVLGIEVSGVPEEHPQHRGHGFGMGVDAWVGDRVTMRFGNGEVRDYRVKGIVKTGGFAADFNTYLTRKEMESVFPEMKKKASEILVRLTDRQAAGETRTRFLSEGVREEVRTWEDRAGFVRDIGGSVAVIAGVTGTVGLLTVAVTMAIIIYINTTHKQRLMGVLKAIGATDGVVFRIFLFEAVLFGLLGIALGIGLSQVLVAGFAQRPIPIPVGGGVVPDVRVELLAVAGVAVLGAGLAAAYYPSWRAARRAIVQSIWG